MQYLNAVLKVSVFKNLKLITTYFKYFFHLILYIGMLKFK